MIAKLTWRDGVSAILTDDLRWIVEPDNAGLECSIQERFDDALSRCGEFGGSPVTRGIAAVVEAHRPFIIEHGAAT